MKKLLLIIAGFFLLGTSNLVFAKETLVIAGSGDPQAVLRALAREYEQVNPGTRIEVPDSIGSTGGIKATAADKVELGRVARPLKEHEKKLGLTYFEFGKAPVVFAVHPSVELQNLSKEEIIGIYSGKIQEWSEVGGPSSKIYPVQRESGETSRTIIENNFNEFAKIEFDAKTVYSTPEMVETLSKHEYTVGYLSLGMIKGTDLKALSIDEIAPTALNVSKGRYVFVGPFALVWKGELSGLAKRFVEFLKSPQAKEILLDYGVIFSDH